MKQNTMRRRVLGGLASVVLSATALVAQKSGGKIKISVFPGAALGSDPQNLSSVRGGTLDFTTMATGLLAGLNKEFMIFDFPFLFKDFREAYAVSDGPVGTRLLAKLADQGV